MTEDASRIGPTSNRGCRRVFSTLCMLFFLLIAHRFYTFLVPSRLVIGPDTTVIEGPLLPDGRVDYVRALNDRMRDGVTPDNNAVVLLIEAFGPEIIETRHPQEYFQLLGVLAPHWEGDYVISQSDWI